MNEPLVLAREGDLVVLQKPAGWVVHAAMARETHDLRAWCAAQADLPRGLEPCHRLDRETSGVVLYASTPEERARIGRMFMEGQVRKRYLALVEGRAHRKGVVRTPLAPDNGGEPQEALTRYRLVAPLGAFALLRVAPETGRKHQVRRHLAEVHLPIVGDDRYGPKARRRVPAYPGRLWLHASRLELSDGRRYEAPLPPELQRNLEALGYASVALSADDDDAGA